MANTKVTTRVIADDAITSDKLASGLTLGGDTTLSGHVSLTDSKEIRFGASDDANIRHDGNNTKFTHTGSGGLYIGADTFGLQVGAHNENFLTAAANGAVTLFHDNAAKLATNSGGITVTGTVTATTYTGALASATTATTQSASDNSTKVATTAYVDGAISDLVDSSPSALNTLNELAAALGDDANFSTTVTNSIATKVPLAGGTMTGTLTGVGVVTNGARNIIQRSNDDASIAFANNASGTPSSHTWAVGYDYSASNGFAIAYANNGLPSLTGSQKFGLDTSGNATFAGGVTTDNITSGPVLINSNSSAFGGSSVQGFNTDFLVDSGKGMRGTTLIILEGQITNS